MKIRFRNVKKTEEEEKQKSNIQYEIVPKRKKKLLVIMLLDTGGAVFKWLNIRCHKFTINEHTYFTEKSGVYVSKNNILISIYIEGCSLPINHSILPKKLIKKTFINPDTNQSEEMEITMISNLKFDSKIADICLNRHLADDFTRPAKDLKGAVTLILILVGVILGMVSVGLQLA